MTSSPTVLIVGGGATGTGLARDLALRGVSTLLVERDGLSSGATSRSHGLLHSGARYAEANRRGAAECIAENEILRSIAGACIRDTGGLFVQLPADDAQYFDRKRAACNEIGIDTTLLSKREARDWVPGLSPDVERAMRVPDGVVYPSRLCAANAADAERHGASVCPHAPLEDLIVEQGTIAKARIGGDAERIVEPDIVVNAAGAWAGTVAAMAGLAVEMAPSRGVMVSVDYNGLGPALNRCRAPDDGDIVVPHDDEAVLGTTSVPVSDPDDYEQADWKIATSVQVCAAMLPPVAEAPTLRTWWGVRPLFAPDERAGGDRRGISRGFFAIDHTNDGVSNAFSIVGGKLTTYRRMAEAVADRVCDALGVDADCTTAARPLPHADDPAQLDALVATYDAQGPTDADVVTTPEAPGRAAPLAS